MPYHKNKEFHVLSESSNLSYGYYEGDDPESAFHVARKDLRDDLIKAAKRMVKPFDPGSDSDFLIEHTMLRWIPVAFARNPDWSDLADKTTSHDRVSIDENKAAQAEEFLRENPEFIAYCRLAVKQWGRVSLQWAAEAYRWPFDAFDLPLRELKAAQVERARIEYEQKYGSPVIEEEANAV